jgi:DedD protein
MSLVFDREPRPAQEELRIQLPARETTVLAPMPSGPSASGAVQPTQESSPPTVNVPPPDKAPSGALVEAGKPPEAKAEAKAEQKDEQKADTKQAAQKADAKPEAKGEGKPEVKTPAKPVESKTDPKPESKPKSTEPKPAAKGRYSVQLGAFASERGANELMAKVKGSTTASIGAQLYTEKVQTSGGERIRVRAGPFGDREAAEQVRAKLKQAGIESALIAP